MRVLVVGKGGRESAIVWKLFQSPIKKEIYTAPGNPFTLRFGKNVKIEEENVESLVKFAKDEKIDIVFPGGETGIALGIADECEKNGIKVVAPKKHVAKLESSKVWAKDFMRRYGIPTADFEYFHKDEVEEAFRFCENVEYPVVIKADGLAGGKGTFIAKNFKEALKIVEDLLVKSKFGRASESIVIERFLRGEEVSVFVISDGKEWDVFAYARDFKRLYDNDEGPNTGGMGSIAPVKLDNETESLIRENIIQRTFEGLNKEGLRYRGILYFGLMITDNGPFVLEYNVRFGDPETQAILPLIEGDLLEALLLVADGNYKKSTLRVKENLYSCCVVLASRGYPENPEKGKEIKGVSDAERISLVFFAGVEEKDGRLYTSGGRVLSVVGLGESKEEARSRAYEGVSKIHFEGMHYRRDINW
ncbi:MAG: phosphoribosylamine--glycine ligase [candidate division WOR-3 bacterium]